MGSPEVGSASWSVRVRAVDDLGVDVTARGGRWHLAAPVSFDTETQGVTAFESLLGAVGGDLVAGLLHLAARRRLPIDHAEAVVRGGIEHPLAHLGVVGEAGTPVVSGLHVEVFVSSPAEEAAVRRVWEDTLARSPIANTFRTVPGLDIRLTVTP